MDRIPTTPAGYEKMKRELEELEEKEREVEIAMAEARAEGDLKENAEYHGRRQELGLLRGKIGQVRGRLAASYIVDPKDMPTDQVSFGCTVTVRDTDDDSEESFTLVGPGDEDYDAEPQRILVSSPLAQQLMNHKLGAKVAVKLPGGTIEYEIVAIKPAE